MVLVLLAASVAVAWMLWVPSASVLAVMDQRPLASAVPVPTTVVPSYSVTVLPASAVPLKVGVVSLVLPPLATLPITGAVLSLALVMVGIPGARVSTVKLSDALWPLSLPAVSLSV